MAKKDYIQANKDWLAAKAAEEGVKPLPKGTAGLFAISSPEQVLIIRVAPGGEMLGGAAVQMAFNLGNAIGAYVGGLAVTGGYRYPALAGVPFALIGFVLFFVFYKKYQAKY